MGAFHYVLPKHLRIEVSLDILPLHGNPSNFRVIPEEEANWLNTSGRSLTITRNRKGRLPSPVGPHSEKELRRKVTIPVSLSVIYSPERGHPYYDLWVHSQELQLCTDNAMVTYFKSFT